MSSHPILRAIISYILLFSLALPDLCAAQATSSVAAASTVAPDAPVRPTSLQQQQQSTTAGSARPSVGSSATPPDVLLNVPQLSVGRIELNVDNLKADINLNANVASLVSINAGVAVSIQKVNLTITDVNAELQLIVRLGHLVDIVNRVFESLDLNPLLMSAVGNLTSVLEPVVGAVDGLLGSITQSGTKLSFLVDNLGNIVQQVAGANGSPVSSIVGNYQTNMTETGASQTLQNGLLQKTYSYTPLNALVNIVFNKAGEVVQASVAKKDGSSSGVSSSASSNPTNIASIS